MTFERHRNDDCPPSPLGPADVGPSKVTKPVIFSCSTLRSVWAKTRRAAFEWRTHGTFFSVFFFVSHRNAIEI